MKKRFLTLALITSMLSSLHGACSAAYIESVRARIAKRELIRATDCAICCELISAPTWSFTLSCNHVFDHLCIAKWLLKNSTCPVCRAEQSFKPYDRHLLLIFALVIAAQYGDDGAVGSLLDVLRCGGGRVACANALVLAAACGHTTTVNVIRTTRPEIDTFFFSNSSALQHACSGELKNIAGPSGAVALLVAAKDGNQDIVTSLLSSVEILNQNVHLDGHTRHTGTLAQQLARNNGHTTIADHINAALAKE